ncbi:hypothetical protein B0H14DRAFT_2602779 [Mycena olivaceomarginata]|nr:hypothetical protein B0H14DRAFT_2602779 [Mycena olivaceomarginata]
MPDSSLMKPAKTTWHEEREEMETKLETEACSRDHRALFNNPKPNPNARRTFRVSAPTHLHGKPPPTAPKPLVFCANGMALSQGLFRRTANPPRSPVRTSEREEEDFQGMEHPSAFDHNGHQTSEFVLSQQPESPRKRRLRENQWTAWTYTVIPQLVPVFIRLLHQTQSFRNTEELQWCSPAAPRLLQGGLFPCSPRHPSLAVDLQVLDFVMSLFVNMTPNNTAFTTTLEGFLSKRGYKLATKDTLRVRFGNALECSIDTAREISLDYSDSCAATRSTPNPEDRLPPSSPPAPSSSPIRLSTRATVSDEEEEDETTSSSPPATPDAAE